MIKILRPETMILSQGVIEPVITNITNHHYKIVYAVPAEGDYTVNVTWSGELTIASFLPS